MLRRYALRCRVDGTEAPVGVRSDVASRLIKSRLEHDPVLSQRVVGEMTGVPPRTVMAVENLKLKQVPLDRVHALAVGLNVDALWMATGVSAGWTGALQDWDDIVRTRLRETRMERGVGTPALAEQAKVAQTWLVRIESGEVQTLDLVRLKRVAEALGLTLAQLINPIEEVEMCDGTEEGSAAE